MRLKNLIYSEFKAKKMSSLISMRLKNLIYSKIGSYEFIR